MIFRLDTPLLVPSALVFCRSGLAAAFRVGIGSCSCMGILLTGVMGPGDVYPRAALIVCGRLQKCFILD